MRWYTPREHMCVEPFVRYAEILRDAGFDVVQATALDALNYLKDGSVDAVYLLDVIEHMERDCGLKVIENARRVARRQVVIFTPDGFQAQDYDAWGLGGERWQTHRSGWTVDDFPGWVVHPMIDENGNRSLFAVWTP